jgi:hypothetical protein
MLNFLNKIKGWLGLADINRDGKINKEDVAVFKEVVKTESKNVSKAKKQAVANVKTAVKRGRPKKTD